ncbi:MAG: hypothetical protein AAF202_05295, partial [Pseudomonadota bacterium]
IRHRVVNFMDMPAEETILRLVVACSVPFSVLLRLYFWVRPRIYSIYEIYPNQFIRVFRNQREMHMFDEIEDVKISMLSPRFFGGFTVKMKNGKKTMFLSALKNSYKLLDLITEQRPELVEPTQLRNYLRMSRIVDVSWKRMKEKLTQWRVLILKLIALPLGLATLTPMISPPEGASLILGWSQWVVIYAGVAVFLEIVLNSLEERFALKTVVWDSEREKFSRNLDSEKKIAQLFTGLYGLGVAIVFGLLLWLN